MPEQDRCPVCGSSSNKEIYADPIRCFCDCPVCGKFEYFPVFAELTGFNLNHLGAYLAYNGFIENEQEYRYFTTMSKEKCDEYRKNFENGDIEHGHPVHLSVENVENWYPKTFSEKIDYILLYLNNHIKHIGENINLREQALISCLFVDRYDDDHGNIKQRTSEQMQSQKEFMLNYLSNNGLIIKTTSSFYTNQITLSSIGFARIDMLQKNTGNGKNVLVAMKFDEETKQLREAIRQGVKGAKYNAIFIDEVEHNDYITPELLKYIKDSRFVVVDLSHQNNGAYFEEGYAMGLGKPVIQLCKKDVNLHFDIAQKNTILWETENDIINRLKNRIIATID
jgi:hypothetical protein